MNLNIPEPNLVNLPKIAPFPRWRLGLVALGSDMTIEHSFQRMLAQIDYVAVHVNRLPFDGGISLTNLKTMETQITDTASEIIPGAPLDALLYGCTSASAAIGDDRVRACLQQARPSLGAAVHTPVSAALSAFKALNVTKVSVITPYPRDVTATLAQYFASMGMKIRVLSCLGLPSDYENGKIEPEELIALAQKINHRDAEAVFLSCTGIRGAEAADRLEAKLGLPVVASNQALLWRGLKDAGCNFKIAGFGRLMQI
ncbi:MAG: aspartate/glutamate racemase family protein [Anderseniella sp.]